MRQALVNLEAVAAPAGTMTVVLGPGWPGVLLHEAVGHGLEGDFNRKGLSAFTGRIGQKVAADCVTVVDVTADTDEVADKIMRSNTFDFGTSCSTENSCLVHESMKDQLIASFEKVGGFVH